MNKEKNVSEWNDEDLKTCMEKPDNEIWLFLA